MDLTYSRVKQPSADAIHGPHGNQYGHGVGQGYKDGRLGAVAVAEALGGRPLRRGDHGVARVAEEEEQKGADKLAQRRDEVVPKRLAVWPSLAIGVAEHCALVVLRGSLVHYRSLIN